MKYIFLIKIIFILTIVLINNENIMAGVINGLDLADNKDKPKTFQECLDKLK
uniref:Uncharacterized protein n=1 Tax=Meloidogyne hapla TaxID=6305 RepID=A0A1I8C177_MELHA